MKTTRITYIDTIGEKIADNTTELREDETKSGSLKIFILRKRGDRMSDIYYITTETIVTEMQKSLGKIRVIFQKL